MKSNELLQALIDTPKDTREFIIYTLLADKHISYSELSKWYVASLERQEERDRSIKAELAACLLQESIYQRGRKNKLVTEQISLLIHRTIAILDIVGCFELESFKKKHNYKEEVGKSQGSFWSVWKKM
jgi:hypothetical protein